MEQIAYKICLIRAIDQQIISHRGNYWFTIEMIHEKYYIYFFKKIKYHQFDTIW